MLEKEKRKISQGEGKWRSETQTDIKEGRTLKKKLRKVKYDILFFFFLVDLIDKYLFKGMIATCEWL